MPLFVAGCWPTRPGWGWPRDRAVVGAFAYSAFRRAEPADPPAGAVGLVYMLVWEGLLGHRSSAAPGVLSIQQYVITVADRIAPRRSANGRLADQAVVMAAVFIGGTRRGDGPLRTFSVAAQTS